MLQVNDTYTISLTTKVNGQLADPTSLTIDVTDPLGAVTSYSWPTPEDITRDFLGTFHLTFTVTMGGRWLWTSSAVDAVITAPTGNVFLVEKLKETCTITVEDDETIPAPMAGVLVQVFNNTAMLASGVTDDTGVVTLYVTPGTYGVALSKLKCVFANLLTMEVEDTGGTTPQTFDFTGTVLDITTTAAGKKTHLYGHLTDMGGEAQAGVRVVVETVGYGNYRPFIIADTGGDGSIDNQPLLIMADKREVRTNADGFWEIDVLQGALLRVQIPDVRFYKIFRVPNDPNNPTTPLLNIRDARPDPGPGGVLGVESDVPGRSQLKGPA